MKNVDCGGSGEAAVGDSALLSHTEIIVTEMDQLLTSGICTCSKVYYQRRTKAL